MCVNEIWCSICCRYMDEECRKCGHFDEQVHLDMEDKVDTSPDLWSPDQGLNKIVNGHVVHDDAESSKHLLDAKMTNFDKLLEDPENREIIMEAVSRKFCINKNELIVGEQVNCTGCGFYEKHKNCDDVILEWLHEEYEEKKAGEE